MDPLSLTLAALTLSTALKDITELARKLNESLKKPAVNMREAETLSAETLEIVQDLKEFYTGHQSILDNAAPDLRGAVTSLLKDMKSVYEECLLILDTSTSCLDTNKFDKIKSTFDLLKNQKEVEMHIRTLKDQANKCYRRFTMLTQLGTAAGVMQLRDTMAQGFAAVQKQQSLRVRDDNVLAFMGSAPRILSHLPPDVKLSEDLVYRSFITIQVGKIDALFKNLASSGGSHPIEEPDSLHLQPFQSAIWLKPSTEEEIRNSQSDVFALIANIQEGLKKDDQRLSTSIQRGAWALSRLTVWLFHLGMFRESVTIVMCAVDLYRTLVKTNEHIYGPRLAHALRLLSGSHVQAGNLVEAYKVITEAVTLGRRLAATSQTFEAHMQLAHLVRHSACVGRLNGDLTNALLDAEEAVQSYKRLIGNPSSSVLRSEATGGFAMKRTSSVMNPDGARISNLAEALAELHYSLPATTRKGESVKAGIDALELYSALERRHDGSAFSDLIAPLCLSLALKKFRDIVKVDEALQYVRQSSHQYEKKFHDTGVIPKGLLDALAMEAEMLSDIGKFDEAYAVCQKIQHIAQRHIDDHRHRAYSFLRLMENLCVSKRHAEAASAGEQLITTYRSSLSDLELFDAYRYTSWAFTAVGDQFKSVQIAEAAVSHWNVLAIHDAKHLKYLAASLSSLARRLLRAASYERAFSEGHETMKLYSSLIKEDSGLLEDYLHALQLNVDIAKEAKMEFQSLERSREVVQYCRALVKHFPDQQVFLIHRLQDHARLLEDFDRLEDASAVIEEALRWFVDNPARDPDSAELHITCLLDSARFLCDRGHPARASSLYDKAISIGRAYVYVYPVALSILWAKASNMLALYDMGQLSLALSELEDCLRFASQHDLEKERGYTWFLELASHNYRWSGDVDKALHIIRRSIDIDKEHARTPFSWILSDLLADVGEEAEALSVAHEAVQAAERWKSSQPFSRVLHVRAQYTLALRAFANDDFSQARELLLQVRLFYQQHSRARNIWFIKLAITLWALGFLECASNRHEEGIMARNELNELRKRLRLLFTSLDDLVEVGLNRERDFQAWKNLLRKHTLTCGHQNDAEYNTTVSQLHS